MQTLAEYIQDTEDLVNIQLDHQRNRLLSCDLTLSGINTISVVLTGLTGIFTVNLMMDTFKEQSATFLEITV